MKPLAMSKSETRIATPIAIAPTKKAVIRAGGGITIAESELSCVVYGMPRAAIRRGAATWVLSLADIADLLAGLN